MTETFLGNIKGPKGDNGDVDSSLSTSSSNPVQNKVVATALNGKANSSHSHNVVNADANGFMGNTMYTKLNGIEANANKTVVDSSLSTTSTNPVRNSVIASELDSKLKVIECGQLPITRSDMTGESSYVLFGNDAVEILSVNVRIRITDYNNINTSSNYLYSSTKINNGWTPNSDSNRVCRGWASSGTVHDWILSVDNGYVKVRALGTNVNCNLYTNQTWVKVL